MMSWTRVLAMTSFAFRCPKTGLKVQSWSDESAGDSSYYEAVECTACRTMHLVNPGTGKVIGSNDPAPKAK